MISFSRASHTQCSAWNIVARIAAPRVSIWIGINNRTARIAKTTQVTVVVGIIRIIQLIVILRTSIVVLKGEVYIASGVGNTASDVCSDVFCTFLWLSSCYRYFNALKVLSSNDVNNTSNGVRTVNSRCTITQDFNSFNY